MERISYYIIKSFWFITYKLKHRYSENLDKIIYDCIWQIENKNATIYIGKWRIIVNGSVSFSFKNDFGENWLTCGRVNMVMWEDLSPSAEASFCFYHTLMKHGKDPRKCEQIIDKMNINYRL